MNSVTLNVKDGNHFVLLGVDNSLRHPNLIMDKDFHEIIIDTGIPLKFQNGPITITIEKTEECEKDPSNIN